MQELITIDRGGLTLRATLHTPDGAKTPAPCLVLCHGFTGNRCERLLVSIARRLEESGVACVRFDCIGSGESDGETRDVTLTSEIEDMIAVVRSVREDERIDPERICIGGHSLGGLVTVCAADALRKVGEDVQALMLLSPALTCYHECIQHLTGKRLADFMESGEVDWGGFVTSREMYDELNEKDGFVIARGLDLPALLLHGTEDGESPVYISVQLSRMWPDNATLSLIDGADHCYRGAKFIEQVCDASEKFMTSLFA